MGYELRHVGSGDIIGIGLLKFSQCYCGGNGLRKLPLCVGSHVCLKVRLHGTGRLGMRC